MALVELSTPTAGVMLITLNRPGRLNALTAPLVAEFSAALDSVAADDRCRIVVLTGAGRGFSAGLDLEGYGDDERTAGQGDVRGTLTRQREIARLAEKLHRLPQQIGRAHV
jgi:enoyl-CoA hydratase